MNNYIQQYKPFLLFLAKFFLTYLVLTVIYQLYLKSYEGNSVDGITSNVSVLSEKLLQVSDENAKTVKDERGEYYLVIYNNNYVGRIIEGCNAVSVIILFVSFIVAFSTTIKPTLLYVLAGSVLIYVLNILRIGFIIMILNKFPEQEHIIHGVVFPLIIYGIVFLLWFLWIYKFYKYASEETK
ncbi:MULTISPECIES: exosortase family protein XrtF [Flavobacterium]|uniref:exosortase family protein XrtF n=1 Tax=Flavobacterium TaxID=237 RepID=UPI002225392A|nr:exosortase family protein XrtF [Flavobacterium sp. N1846]